ncbi:hypothetical protein C4Y11_28465, partial [Escherichia coli]|uniref:hypothetical protein n=1 Tax=Escherichia coli TaxID=562 RepID=UPI000D4D887D
QKQKKRILLPSETMIWQPEFTDKTLSRKTGAVPFYVYAPLFLTKNPPSQNYNQCQTYIQAYILF